jgi:hypothetical protein
VSAQFRIVRAARLLALQEEIKRSWTVYENRTPRGWKVVATADGITRNGTGKDLGLAWARLAERLETVK